MLARFLAWLRSSTTRPVAPLIALAVTLVLGCYLRKQGADLPGGALSLQRTCDCETATAIVQSWRGSREKAVLQVLLDFPFIAAYAYFLFAVGSFAARDANRRKQTGHERLATWAAYAALLAGCFDVLENFGLLAMLWSTTVKQPLPMLTWLASTAKFFLIAAAILLPLVTLLRRLLPDTPMWNFDQVFAAEYREIFARDGHLPNGPAGGNRRTVENGLIGLALSGGGIRSAAFALGGLQSLNERGILQQTHYLSTVSGGGYIGTAMTVGMSTNDDGEFPYGKTGHDVDETPATRWLRDHSRYLVQEGVTSVLSALAVYLRGLMANILIVFPALLAVAALFLWWLPDTQMQAVGHDWICPLKTLGTKLKTLTMPLSLVAVGLTAALLVLYAILVSILPIISQKGRSGIASYASGVLWVVAAIVLYELHCWLPGFIFERMAQDTANQTTDLLTTLLSSTKALIALLVASLGGIFPFIKRIANAAVSDKQEGVSDALKRWGSRALLIAAAAIVPLLLWLLLLQLIFWGTGLVECVPHENLCNSIRTTWSHAPDWFQSVIGTIDAQGPPASIQPWKLYAIVAAVLFALALCLSVNANSLHQLYRDRLGSAFLGAFTVKRMVNGREEEVSLDTFRLQDIDTAKCPYHLINAALNVPGSRFANRRGRNADFFVFSKLFTGSEMTSYVKTSAIEDAVDGLNMATAMAISGAAAAPNMGMASMRPLSLTIAFLNVRLGRWIKHPQGIPRLLGRKGLLAWWHRTPGLTYLLREAFFKSGNDLNPDGFVFLTDGGHIENLGVYELLRRRCKIIIAIDGEADPDLTGGSLVQLERFARIDLGTTITMDWKEIGEMTRKVSKDVKEKVHDPKHGPHVALGSISYPGATPATREYGLLVYVKASLSGDENDYVMNYKATNASFPHETTLDQFFSEEQFECYRALGEHIMRRFLSGDDRASPNAKKRWDLVKMFNETVRNATIA